MKILLVDDGFDISVIDNKSRIPNKMDVREAPTGISFWEGTSLLMESLSEEEAKKLLAKKLFEDYSTRGFVQIFLEGTLNIAKNRGYYRYENKHNEDAPFFLVISD